MTKDLACPFCEIAESGDHERILDQSEFGFVIRDGFPVTDGHSLVIPKRHIQSFFDLTEAERSSLIALLGSTKEQLDLELSPAAYNIGINDGPAAGQTVPHMHIHLIPRYAVEGVDPRGGVRWVVPEKANYWKNNEHILKEISDWK